MLQEKLDKRTSAQEPQVSTQQVLAVEEEKEVAAVEDGVFGGGGGEREGAVNYNTVGWFGTSVLLMKTQIGLGVLSLPYVLSVFGAIPGVFIILGVAIITTWSDLEVGRWKLRHPECYSLSDVGFIIAGPWGREIFGFTYLIFELATVGSAFVGLSVALNAISLHGTCTAVFIAAMAVAALLLASIRTLNKISFLSYIGLASILSAILTLAIAVSLQSRPSLAPQTGPWNKGLLLTNRPSFSDAMLALSTVVFSFAGTPAFLPIASEMKRPRDYMKAAILCQAVVTSTFLIIGIIVYYYCGEYVASPALGSAGPLLKRICYGLALPGLLVSMTIYTHLSAKWVLVRLLRGTPHLTANSIRHWVTWEGCILGCVLVAYLFASAVPSFNSIVGLFGALCGTFLCMQAMALMWLHDEGEEVRSGKKRNWLGSLWCFFVLAIGTFIMIGGTYGSIVSIIDTYKADPGSAWSCADNSGTVPSS
ncbi:transmembrane amino acid transporter protein-domain-containing protein [Leucosporidium creatinivorum]|uniref:Transmembrane amino acid transporter protein-domain-containing protein n=1 Tax=Leucosporidium creatinivorum TaxID=106004 RepID=A0A1Y2BTG1_9BASI|nr:transmembrane amino acid transporter protein-domain-containing protein [Leucosporidium creatinivorum]